MRIKVYLEKGPKGKRLELVLPGEKPPTREQVREIIKLTFGEEYRYRVVHGSFSPVKGKKW